MNPGAWPVAITSIGGAAVATVVWRRLAQLHVTVVVKGSFGFVPDGVMTPIEPEPIARDEQPDAAGVGLAAAGDLAPYLGHTDVWLTGHAPVPARSPRDHDRLPGSPTGAPSEPPSVTVRLGVFRDSVALLDKSLELSAPEVSGLSGREHGPPAHPRRIPIAGMGPLSRAWPIRSRLLGALDPRRLEGAIVEIPDLFDWSYFQVAPLDQRIESLHGDEWVVLKGMHPERDSLATRLPGAVGAARLYGQAQGLRRGRPLRLSADTLRIDADRQICSLTWRAQFPVSGEDALAGMHLVAGVELPGRPLVWVDPFQPGPPARPARPAPSVPIAPPVPAAASGDPLGGTMDMSAADAAVLLAGIVTPFRPDTPAEGRRPRSTPADSNTLRVPVAPRPRPAVAGVHDPLGVTADVDAEAAAQARAGHVTPFVPIAVAPAHDPLGVTADVDAEAAAQARAGHVTPFVPIAVAPARPIAVAPAHAIALAPFRDPLGATADLDAEAAAQARAGHVTPFDAAPAPPASRVEAIPVDEMAGTPDFLSVPRAAFSQAEQAPPLRINVAPAPPVLSEEPQGSSKGLGAHFLAAMASARSQGGAA